MDLKTGNLFEEKDEPAAQNERSVDLHRAPGVRISRIESNAYSSPEDFWYDQDDDEWVAVISGDAVIELADGAWHAMGTGDWIVIPAHTRHRILGTSEKTVWLAVHMGSPSSGLHIRPGH